MPTFDFTYPNKEVGHDHRPSFFPAVVLVICALILLPFTLLCLLVWGLAKVFWKPDQPAPEILKSRP